MLSRQKIDIDDVNSNSPGGRKMGCVKSNKKRGSKKLKMAERENVIIIPTKKLINWCKIHNG